jgi:hypothetical protein
MFPFTGHKAHAKTTQASTLALPSFIKCVIHSAVSGRDGDICDSSTLVRDHHNAESHCQGLREPQWLLGLFTSCSCTSVMDFLKEL